LVKLIDLFVGLSCQSISQIVSYDLFGVAGLYFSYGWELVCHYFTEVKELVPGVFIDIGEFKLK
jgi:hypothetical protein